MTTSTATLVGLAAIVMWSLLAALTVATGRCRRFSSPAITFAIGACDRLGLAVRRPSAVRCASRCWCGWSASVGLFGYHALYFLGAAARAAGGSRTAQLSLAAADRAVLRACCRASGSRLHHIAGALLGFAGTIVLFRRQCRFGAGARIFAGISFAAFVAAFVWASYSVLSRQLAAGADRCGRRILSRDGGARYALCHLAFWSDGVAGDGWRSGLRWSRSASVRSVSRSMSGTSA